VLTRSCAQAGIDSEALCTPRKPVAEAMSYYAFASLRAATILHHNKQAVEVMWGRLLTCGRLVIGLPPAVRKIQADGSPLRLAAMWGRLPNLQPISKSAHPR
jgi:hypothetical protein